MGLHKWFDLQSFTSQVRAVDHTLVDHAPGGGLSQLVLRTPEPRDGARMFAFVKQTGGLELNSAYAYVLVCERFARSCLIAEAGESLIGFVLGLESAEQPETLFVWQIGVRPEWRGLGLAARMLDTLLACTLPGFLEAHVAVGNAASEALFRATAQRHHAPVAVEQGLLPDWFAEQHAQERLFRIGPLLR